MGDSASVSIERQSKALGPAAAPLQVREIIRTNLGSMMISLLRPIHRFKLWVLRYDFLAAPYPPLPRCGFLGMRSCAGAHRSIELRSLSFKQLALRDEEPYTPWLHCGFHRMLVGKGHTRKWLIPAPGL
eukprot:1159211-Pelagomonas_calceolata.AAC.19